MTCLEELNLFQSIDLYHTFLNGICSKICNFDRSIVIKPIFPYVPQVVDFVSHKYNDQLNSREFLTGCEVTSMT